MLESDAPPIVLDVRTRSQYEKDKSRIPDSIRVRPDGVEEWARDQEEERGGQSEGQRIVAYCT
jgi:rhodanese-related sulfurtransferase